MKATLWMLMAATVLGLVFGGCGAGRVPGLPDMDTYILNGRATGDGGQALVYASVALAGSPLGTVTDDQGRFGFDGLRPGTYGLTVIYLGFRSAEFRFTVPTQEETTVSLAMVRDQRLGPALADSLEPVTVNLNLARAQ